MAWTRRWRWAVAAGACLAALRGGEAARAQQAAGQLPGVVVGRPVLGEEALPPPRPYPPQGPGPATPGGPPVVAPPGLGPGDPDMAPGPGPSGADPLWGTGGPCAAPGGAGPATPRRRSLMRWLQECFLGFPDQFEAAPLGQSVYRHYAAHVANGTAVRMALYQYDFVAGCPALNQRGKDQLVKIAAMLARTDFPLVIERTPWEPALAEARRLTVLQELAGCPFPVPPERVVIGPPPGIGLSGVEAERVYRNLLDQTLNQGLLGGPGGGAIGGFGAPVRPAVPLGTIP
jgi:hypothetical protein